VPSRRLLSALRFATLTPAAADESHTVAVSQLWLSRATRTLCPSSMWPRWLLTTIEAQLDSCFAGWKSCLIAGHPGRSFDYVNSRGEPCSNTPEEVIQKSSVILRITEGR
jgi:hypothetical protein